jgi:hypothetical protein
MIFHWRWRQVRPVRNDTFNAPREVHARVGTGRCERGGGEVGSAAVSYADIFVCCVFAFTAQSACIRIRTRPQPPFFWPPRASFPDLGPATTVLQRAACASVFSHPKNRVVAPRDHPLTRTGFVLIYFVILCFASVRCISRFLPLVFLVVVIWAFGCAFVRIRMHNIESKDVSGPFIPFLLPCPVHLVVRCVVQGIRRSSTIVFGTLHQFFRELDGFVGDPSIPSSPPILYSIPFPALSFLP